MFKQIRYGSGREVILEYYGKTGMADNDGCAELVEEYRYLWDPNDPKFCEQSQAHEWDELLAKYKSLSDTPVNIVTLKQWFAVFHRVKSGRIAKTVCKACHYKCKEISQLVEEFPCLWDADDLNFKDQAVKTHCLEMLLAKYNGQASVSITMKQLKTKLATFNQIQAMCPAKSLGTCGLSVNQLKSRPDAQIEKLVKEYPCLWDPQDPKYRDKRLRARCYKKLLKKYNSVSSIPIKMDELKTRLTLMRRKLARRGKNERLQAFSEQLTNLAEEFPCLWDPQDPGFQDKKLRARSHKELLAKCNASSIPITTEELKMRLRTMRRDRTAPDKGIDVSLKAYMEQMAVMMNEYPCLWDPLDEDYRNPAARARCRGLLLLKYNRAVPTSPITMDELEKKLKDMDDYLLHRGAQLSLHESQAAGPAVGLPIHAQLLREDSTSSSDPIDTIKNEPQEPIHEDPLCCCCGKADEGVDITNKPYVAANKTTLTLNELSVELDFNTTKTICQSCDIKLLEIHDFVKLVKDNKMINDKADETECFIISDDSDDDRNDINVVKDVDYNVYVEDDDEVDRKDVIESLSVTNTEFVKQTVTAFIQKSTTELPKRKSSVTFDFSCLLPNIDRSNDNLIISDRKDVFSATNTEFVKLKLNNETGILNGFTVRSSFEEAGPAHIKEEYVEMVEDTVDKEVELGYAASSSKAQNEASQGS